MNKKIFVLGALAFVPLIAVADKINLKTGLWETTTTTDFGAAMPAMPSIPPDVLAKMPPEQRARVESMLASRAAPGNTTSRSCVTEKDLERGMKPETSKEQQCKVDSVKTTGNTQEMHISCTSSHGNGSGTGVFTMTTAGRESFDGAMEMNMNTSNRPMTIKMKLKGKWLGTDCGDVKPREN